MLSTFWGCVETTNSLQVDKDKVCLNQGDQSSCAENAPFVRLSLKNGKPELSPIKLSDDLGRITFPQYSKPAEFAQGTYSIGVQDSIFTLTQGNTKLTAPSNLGFVMRRDRSGNYEIVTGTSIELKSRLFGTSKDGFISLGPVKGDSIVLQGSRPIGGVMTTTFMMAYHDIQSRIIPTDTGTEVVILDDFKPSTGSCEAEQPDECCPPGESAGEARRDITDIIDDFQAQGEDLMACFNIGTVCLFTNGSQLIIVICDSQERYCLDFSICPVTITVSSEYGICISVPLECGIPNPF